MSFEKDLKLLKLPPDLFKKVLKAQKQEVKELKVQKRVLEVEIRALTRQGRVGGRWKTKRALAEVQVLQYQRTIINRKIYRFGGSKKKNPEFDSD